MLTALQFAAAREELHGLGFPADDWDDSRVERAFKIVLDLERGLDYIGYVRPQADIAHGLEFILDHVWEATFLNLPYPGGYFDPALVDPRREGGGEMLT